jgi:hypothetical protein
MHLRFCMHEHFDLFTNSSKYKCETSQIFTSISKNYDECKMQFMNSGFNNIQSEWFNSCANVNSSKDAKQFTNPFIYKCETLSCYTCFNVLY